MRGTPHEEHSKPASCEIQAASVSPGCAQIAGALEHGTGPDVSVQKFRGIYPGDPVMHMDNENVCV